MITRLLEKQLLRHRQQQREWVNSLQSAQGFTLTELLIVVIISSIIVSALLTLVIQLVGTEQRESVRTETQREMQLAMNYITSDLRQAVFIYEGTPHPNEPASEPSYINYLPAPLRNADNYRPVLAFWKTKPIQLEGSGLPAFNPGVAGGGCRTFAQLPRINECNNLWLKRQNYSLVAYFQAINNADTNPNGRWTGRSRIVRYELDKYSNVATLARNQGYVDPAEIGTSGFTTWPWGPSGTAATGAIVNCQGASCASQPAAGVPTAAPDTLVDFVDLATDAGSRAGEPDDCGVLDPSRPVDPDGNLKNAANSFIDYYMTPPQSAAFPKPAFFVCLKNTRDPSAPTNPRVGQIQDTVVFLRGNANGRGGTNTDSFLPTLETRVTMRGVIDRVIR